MFEKVLEATKKWPSTRDMRILREASGINMEQFKAIRESYVTSRLERVVTVEDPVLIKESFGDAVSVSVDGKDYRMVSENVEDLFDKMKSLKGKKALEYGMRNGFVYCIGKPLKEATEDPEEPLDDSGDGTEEETGSKEDPDGLEVGMAIDTPLGEFVVLAIDGDDYTLVSASSTDFVIDRESLMNLNPVVVNLSVEAEPSHKDRRVS